MDVFSIAVSVGLQHNVPLATYVERFANVRFEPAGMTDDPDIRIASSLADYIFRRLALDYLPFDERAQLGVFSAGERMQPTLPGVLASGQLDVSSVRGRDDGPICANCDVQMQRAGVYHVCPTCGGTTARA